MRIKIFSVLNFLVPICLLGFMGAYLTYINRIFNENTRWFFFITLFIFLILRKSLIRSWNPVLALTLLFYIIWCFLTSFWSNIYILSLLKSIMLGLVIVTMVTAGIEWVKTHSWENSINYIGLLAYITLFAAFLGKIDSSAAPISEGLTSYRGSFVTGSNMLGFYMAASFPFFLWKMYIQKVNGKKYVGRLCLMLACLYFLAASISRGAIAATIATLAGFILSLSLTKKITIFILIVLISGAAFVFYYEEVINTATTYIYKTESATDLFSSRKLLWQRSYDGAIAGGLTGLGYGVTAEDDNFKLEYGLTSSHYGQEKGNSQLAIIEETGLIGFMLYIVLLITLISKLFRLYIAVANPHQRVLVGILAGMFVGMIIQSCVEGWWGAPGGPETVYFWLLVGIMRGLEITIVKNNARPSITISKI
ncbi:MAG TPA: O-antigen ligase family protein [Gammaproteobacteria bacterium]|nr:O-antigen ligase family protein [Gammaproteobacteria bacterium]